MVSRRASSSTGIRGAKIGCQSGLVVLGKTAWGAREGEVQSSPPALPAEGREPEVVADVRRGRGAAKRKVKAGSQIAGFGVVRWASAVRHSAPLQGLVVFYYIRIPRALPWAVVARPYRATRDTGRRAMVRTESMVNQNQSSPLPVRCASGYRTATNACASVPGDIRSPVLVCSLPGEGREPEVVRDASRGRGARKGTGLWCGTPLAFGIARAIVTQGARRSATTLGYGVERRWRNG
jgi:hypothetical protein